MNILHISAGFITLGRDVDPGRLSGARFGLIGSRELSGCQIQKRFHIWGRVIIPHISAEYIILVYDVRSRARFGARDESRGELGAV